ncbi:ABC transporter substrate-binding protein [Roseomonas sp. SSH11]|uniref:ABC transporter substrate-binding protein n=1 Tax=Pararoseomonas baculiformis TaxID=2820812 RepID=A0ABS4A884_9PROT|nr:ABC transporter substrate-binding protein [Pararoseomonas baculiformis]MBP0443209.1 ABC transporter substrate-binding protein [Pararoseomonas baculiformis]
MPRYGFPLAHPITRRLLASAPLALAAAPTRAQARDLTVVSWGGAYQDAQREVMFRPFQRSTGQRLLEETWDGGMDSLRDTVRTASWDIVQVEGDELLLGCAEGLLERIPPERVGGEAHYLPGALTPCGVGNIIYGFVLAYRRGGVAPDGWADFFDLGRFPGRRAMRRGAKTTLEIALLGDGVAPGEIYTALRSAEGVNRAFRKLETIRPALRWWDQGSEPPRMLSAGEATLVVAYNGRIDAANREDSADLGIVWAGQLLAQDSWAILRNSPNRERALAFLRFVGDPALQAGLPLRIPYGVTARGAESGLPDEVLENLPTAPGNARGALRIDDEFWHANLDRLERRFAEWLAAGLSR